MPKRCPENAFPESIGEALKREPDPDKLLRALGILASEPTLALGQLKMLADQGSLLSMVFIGDAYLHGRGVEPDIELGKALIERAIDGGSIEGRFRMGNFFEETGQYDKSINERRILAEYGYSPAMYLLAWMYYNGRDAGVTIDIDKAIFYWTMAAEAGHLHAKRQLSYIYRTGKFGIFKMIRGHIMPFCFLVPFVRYTMCYPKSDRLREAR